MRKVFIQTLIEIAEHDRRVVLLTADLGFMVLEPFVKAYPDRFYNIGVAEANMMGIATGMAEAGYIPFVYSIATFASMRAYEQLRDGPILHHLPVRVAGIGGGFEYGNSGVTHYSLEDIGIMRTQPGLQTIVPADPAQTVSAVQQTYQLPGPIYYRIGKNDNLTVPGLNGRFRLNTVETIGDGRDLLILATGAISAEAVKAAESLAQQCVSCTVAVVSTLQPDSTAELAALLGGFSTAITVEAHFINGGLGSLVAETIAENGINCRLIRCGVRSMPSGVSGSEAYMNQLYELTAEHIVQKSLAHLQTTKVHLA